MLFNHLKFSLVRRLFNDLLQIVFSRKTVWAIDCYAAILFGGEIIVVGS